MPDPPVTPRPAATVVLLRPAADGPEVLLTRRPSTMAFGPDLHVFPGGAVEPDDAPRAGTDDPWAVGRHAAAREAREEAGLELDPDTLVPLSLWTTPPVMPRRYSTRFYAAELPPGASLTFDPREVVDHVWLTPTAALEAMADGDIDLWIPTSSTLAQLEGARDLDDVRARFRHGAVEPPRVAVVAPAVREVVTWGGGGIPGRRTTGRLVGRERFVLVDHADPSDAAADAVIAAVGGPGRLAAIALTSPAPDHSAGAEGLALRLGIPILAGRGARRRLPHEVVELDDEALVDAGDVPLRVRLEDGVTGRVGYSVVTS